MKKLQDEKLFQFEDLVVEVKGCIIKGRGQKETRHGTAVLRLSVSGVGPTQLAALLNVSTAAVENAFWPLENVSRTAQRNALDVRFPLLSVLAVASSYTKRHRITIGDLPEQAVYLLDKFAVEPQAGMLSRVSFVCAIHGPDEAFAGGIGENMRDPVSITLTQDPELPFPDSDGERGADDGEGGAQDDLPI